MSRSPAIGAEAATSAGEAVFVTGGAKNLLFLANVFSCDSWVRRDHAVND
jgi:hypothetical protein